LKNRAVLKNNKDKLIVLKVFAPWCKACKGLAPKFQGLVRDEKYKNLPIVWADLNIQGNKDFVKSIGVLALPTVQLYAGDGIKTDTFPCGPSKVPILKRKLIKLVNDHVDAKTRTLKTAVAGYSPASESVVNSTSVSNEAANGTLSVPPVASTNDANATISVTPSDDVATAPKDGEQEESVEEIIEREKSYLRNVKYMSEMLESDYEDLLSKATLLTFEAGSIVMREGNMGRTFYIILDGEVEICQRTSFEDPLTTPPSYLGTVINHFTGKGDFFGERSLITGEPRAASIRASSRVKCLAFDKGSFPKTSILSGFSDTTSQADKEKEIEEINDKYGVALSGMSDMNDDKLYRDTIAASQVRGSVNSPSPINGVDNDEVNSATSKIVDDPSLLGVETSTMVPLLMRLKLIRSITRCFDYTVQYKLKFGDAGSRRRRNILVEVLSPMQRTYIEDAFNLIDEDKSEHINLRELRRVMESVGEQRSDAELLDVIEKRNYAPWQDDTKTITKEDFFGLMAESETYQLFIDTFQMLDPKDSGFVRAQDLDRILCGVRDLISDDRKSIIDVEDMEMMVDYEQFSRMLLGTSLKI
jgi:CRP-like cAMP-binding protein/Ca2+-binding EF-hand superfamily protein